MNGGNTSGGPNDHSGKGIEDMGSAKWRDRYEKQVLANNILSDRLRLTRHAATKHMTMARTALEAARDRITMLENIIKANGFDIDSDEGNKSEDK